LNPDAELRDGALASMVGFLESHADVAVVGPRVLDPDGSIQQSARSFPNMSTALFGRTSFLTRVWPTNPMTRRNLRAGESDAQSYLVDWVAGSCLMVRFDVFRRAGGLDNRFFMYWEDADFCRRVRGMGWKTAYLPTATVVHQCGRSSRQASIRSLVAFHRSALRYYVKHHSGPARYIGAPMAAAALAVRLSIKILSTSARQLRALGSPSQS
jgi:GT2 family glycosyltransferase